MTRDPGSNPQLHAFLTCVVGFDCVDDERCPSPALLKRNSLLLESAFQGPFPISLSVAAPPPTTSAPPVANTILLVFSFPFFFKCKLRHFFPFFLFPHARPLCVLKHRAVRVVQGRVPQVAGAPGVDLPCEPPVLVLDVLPLREPCRPKPL